MWYGRFYTPLPNIQPVRKNFVSEFFPTRVLWPPVMVVLMVQLPFSVSTVYRRRHCTGLRYIYTGVMNTDIMVGLREGDRTGPFSSHCSYK